MAIKSWVFAAAVLAAFITGPWVPAATASEWTWPLQGPVVTPYSNDNARPYAGGMHRGIDIAAPVGTAVRAAHAGNVTFAGPLGSAGLTVAVSDGRHVASYLHLASAAVGRGETVARGARVGEVGTSGARSIEAPHLHFGVRAADRDHFYVDPLTLLPALAAGGGGPPPVTEPVPAPLRTEAAPVPSRSPAHARSRPQERPARPRVPLPGLPRTVGVPVEGLRAPAARGSRRAASPLGQRELAGSAALHPRFAPSGPRPGRMSDRAAGEAGAERVVERAPRSQVEPGVGPGWGRALALAGLALLVTVLARGRFGVAAARMRAARASRAAGGEHRPQPCAGVPDSRPPVLRSLPEMG